MNQINQYKKETCNPQSVQVMTAHYQTTLHLLEFNYFDHKYYRTGRRTPPCIFSFKSIDYLL